jgi:hypothetical protein
LRSTPKIPKDAISNILKPVSLGLAVGSKAGFRITAPHKANAGGTSGTLYSIPVRTSAGSGGEGDFPLNKTHMAMFIEKLGDDSDVWVGANYDAFVVPQNNPQSKQLVLSRAVVKDTITAPKSKGK